MKWLALLYIPCWGKAGDLPPLNLCSQEQRINWKQKFSGNRNWEEWLVFKVLFPYYLDVLILLFYWPLTNALLELLCQKQSLSKNWKSCHFHYLLSWQYALEMPYNRRNVVMSYRVKWLATFCLRTFYIIHNDYFL